jgi:hypothetical protein
MQARPVKAASGSDLARLTAIGNLGVNARLAGFGRTETDCPFGTSHCSGFNSADLADVRQRVITTRSRQWPVSALRHRKREFGTDQKRAAKRVKYLYLEVYSPPIRTPLLGENKT